MYANEFCYYKYHQEKLGDIKAPRYLIIEQCMAVGRGDSGADSWLLQLRNNDAPKQTVGSQHGRRVCAEAGILRKTLEAQWQGALRSGKSCLNIIRVRALALPLTHSVKHTYIHTSL